MQPSPPVLIAVGSGRSDQLCSEGDGRKQKEKERQQPAGMEIYPVTGTLAERDSNKCDSNRGGEGAENQDRCSDHEYVESGEIGYRWQDR